MKQYLFKMGNHQNNNNNNYVHVHVHVHVRVCITDISDNALV